LDHQPFYFTNLVSLFNLIFLGIIGDALLNEKNEKMPFKKAAINFEVSFFVQEFWPRSNSLKLKF
jgi:hypothetical protein